MAVFLALTMAPQNVSAGFLGTIARFFKNAGAENVEAEAGAATVTLPIMSSRMFPLAVAVDEIDQIDENVSALSVTQDNALIASRNPSGALPDRRTDQIFVYTVGQGDTPALVADHFGISLNTLLWANDLKKTSRIKIGDELIILPVTGIQYTIKRGDTLELIAKEFGGDSSEIASFNGLGIGESLKPGTAIIIPDGEFTSVVSAPATERTSFGPIKNSVWNALPDFQGYFMRPIFGGRRSRGLHGFNGVDLAQSCGLPVLASAEGTIIVARSSGWHGGYGKYVVLSHPNGTQTLYGHLSAILGSLGQKVAQGSQIATIGSTGNSTGCHVHFEIRGAKNPF